MRNFDTYSSTVLLHWQQYTQ